MSVIERERAAAILRPYEARFGDVLWMAWQRWRREPSPAVRASSSKRTRACLVYDYVLEEAWRQLDGVEGLHLSDARGFVIVTVEGRLLVRFKKATRSLRTSGIPTLQARLFAEQEPIPGMPIATHLVAGYVLDPSKTEIERMAFICSIGSRRIWDITIPEPGPKTVVEHPAVPDAPTSPVVRSKRSSAEEDEARDLRP